MPGRFDQQPTHMGIAGLGDRPLHAGVARGVLTGHQADVGADRGPGEPGPVTDLDRQRQTGQCRDAAQTAQPVDRVGRRTAAAGGGVETSWLIALSRTSLARYRYSMWLKPARSGSLSILQPHPWHMRPGPPLTAVAIAFDHISAQFASTPRSYKATFAIAHLNHC